MAIVVGVFRLCIDLPDDKVQNCYLNPEKLDSFDERIFRKLQNGAGNNKFTKLHVRVCEIPAYKKFFQFLEDHEVEIDVTDSFDFQKTCQFFELDELEHKVKVHFGAERDNSLCPLRLTFNEYMSILKECKKQLAIPYHMPPAVQDVPPLSQHWPQTNDQRHIPTGLTTDPWNQNRSNQYEIDLSAQMGAHNLNDKESIPSSAGMYAHRGSAPILTDVCSRAPSLAQTTLTQSDQATSIPLDEIQFRSKIPLNPSGRDYRNLIDLEKDPSTMSLPVSNAPVDEFEIKNWNKESSRTSSMNSGSLTGVTSTKNPINELQEYVVSNKLKHPQYIEDRGMDGLFSVKCIVEAYIEEAFDKVEDTAKRMAAKKMLKLLGVKTYYPDPDKIPDITTAIEFFKSHLRNKKGKLIDAFDTMQRNDGRSAIQHMVQTATFSIFPDKKIPDCEIKDSHGLFEATADFKIQFKVPVNGRTQVRETTLLTVISRHFQKKQAQKIAYNRIVNKAYKVLIEVKDLQLTS